MTKKSTKNQSVSNHKKYVSVLAARRVDEGKDVKSEAEFGSLDGKEAQILGISVSGSPKSEVLKKIVQVCEEKAFNKPFFVVTAYSEFFLEAKSDKKFKSALALADMVLPDGVSVPAAADYLSGVSGNKLRDFLRGLAVGAKVLQGEYRDKTIVGVKLTQELIAVSANNGWRVFLLGGFGDTAEKLTYKLRWEYPGLEISYDEGPQNLRAITNNKYQITNKLQAKIDKFRPEILFVALGRYEQEKWIAANLNVLRSKVVMGVGSSFDEILGRSVWAEKPPEFVERMGIKWLWRVFKDPKHLKRAWRAFPVFAWKVFMSTNKSSDKLL